MTTQHAPAVTSPADASHAQHAPADTGPAGQPPADIAYAFLVPGLITLHTTAPTETAARQALAGDGATTIDLDDLHLTVGCLTITGLDLIPAAAKLDKIGDTLADDSLPDADFHISDIARVAARTLGRHWTATAGTYAVTGYLENNRRGTGIYTLSVVEGTLQLQHEQWPEPCAEFDGDHLTLLGEAVASAVLDDLCRNEDCGQSTADGEGRDGECGNCADRTARTARTARKAPRPQTTDAPPSAPPPNVPGGAAAPRTPGPGPLRNTPASCPTSPPASHPQTRRARPGTRRTGGPAHPPSLPTHARDRHAQAHPRRPRQHRTGHHLPGDAAPARPARRATPRLAQRVPRRHDHPAHPHQPLLEVAMANTAHGKKNARLHFPLDRVLAAAEHAAAAPSHQLGYGETEAAPRLWWIKSDGTCLMSNGRTPTSTPGTPDDSEYLPTTVHADGWGPGTDARSILGGDDFRQSIELTRPLDENGTTLLGMLRDAAARDATRFSLHAVFDDRHMELTYITE
ncbi:hypothetical protein ACFQ9Z_38710 [Streptomyces sp. NPDC056580]|uniref:hypothetical protein n=1 Tax=Streptomyces sp. NPDC056580 TaxID=3345872 RepID=UPI0036B8A596